MSRYDIAIIGTGPAGISSALTAKQRNKNVILFGPATLSDKVRKAERINNYPGLVSVSGEEMQKAFLAHLESADISIIPEKITLIMPMGDYFMLQSSANEIYEASAVIIAAGMVSGKKIEGEEELLGMGVSYCATCDAALYKGKKAAVIAYSKDEESEANFLAEYTSELIYIPMYKEEAALNNDIKIIREKPLSISGDMKTRTLVTDKNSYEVDGVFVLRESIAPGQLIPGLEMDGNHVKTGRDMSTSIPGCFAAGDICGQPYQYVKSAGEGNVAALSAVKYLDSSKSQK